MRGGAGLLVLAQLVAAVAIAVSSDPARAASAEEPPRALFALIVGVNASPAPDRPPLRYADDDAARYLDLFRALGARAYVLARLDSATRALHPQAAAEALPPQVESLRRAVDALARDIAQARARGVKSTLYVVYAGHGDARDSSWYLTLEDGALGEAELLSNVVERAGADQSHVIIDACHAYLLARPRGRGETRRPLTGFVALEAASRAGRIGFLLSTSASGETHEWAGFEAGVFSHAVRSGLYGAADADGDHQVRYAEIAAFVHRASEEIANERFRPKVLARPPAGGDVLLDLRPRRETELRFEGPERAAHYLLEDAQGVRLLDFHGSGSTPLHLARSAGQGPLYLRRVADGTERVVPRTDGPVRVDDLPVVAAHAQPRGAANDAFGKLFSLGFDGAAVASWAHDDAEATLRAEHAQRENDAARRQEARRRVGGWSAVGVGAVAAIAAGLCELSAYRLQQGARPFETQQLAAERNDAIDARNAAAIGLGIGAAAALTTGAVLLLWPSRTGSGVDVDVAALPSRAGISARWHF